VVFLLVGDGWWWISNACEEESWWRILFAVTPSVKIVDQVEQPFWRVH
jgi:hypothetical protein